MVKETFKVNNMKKYKLIKKYPGSPELGHIIDGGNIVYPEDRITRRNSGTWFVPISHFDDKEFWEEVVEEDYEILSYRQVYRGKIFVKNDRQQFKSDDGYTLYNPLKERTSITIHSVRRNNDGEIFTVGDTIEYSYPDRDGIIVYKKYSIEKIYLLNNKDLIFYVGNGLNLGGKNLIKVKSTIFTTEDNVDIYSGDKVYVVFSNYREGLFEITETNYKTYYRDSTKTFSCKEAADEYILRNKQCLSYNDVLDILENSSKVRVDLVRKLVKTKI